MSWVEDSIRKATEILDEYDRNPGNWNDIDPFRKVMIEVKGAIKLNIDDVLCDENCKIYNDSNISKEDIWGLFKAVVSLPFNNEDIQLCCLDDDSNIKSIFDRMLKWEYQYQSSRKTFGIEKISQYLCAVRPDLFSKRLIKVRS